jgi:hypothetical protein
MKGFTMVLGTTGGQDWITSAITSVNVVEIGV